MAGSIAFSARTGIAGGAERLERAMIEASRAKLTAAAEATGEASQDLIVKRIGGIYGDRQGKKRSEPLATPGNYTYRVNTRPKGVELVFEVKGSENFMKKFGALNFGAGPHVIAPRASGALSNRQDTSRNPAGFFSRVPVTWSTSSGKFGTKFWQAAVKEALDGLAGRL